MYIALLVNAVARIVACEVQIIIRKTCLIHGGTWILGITIPLVETEPVILIMHRVDIVLHMRPTKASAIEDPKVHHDFRRELWYRNSTTRMYSHSFVVDEPCN